MKRVWGHVLAGLSVMAGACAICSACTHDDSSIFVKGVLAQQVVANGQTCVYTSDPTQPMVSGGTLDVDFLHEYGAEVLVGNQLVARANPQQLQTETSIVTIQGAVVRVTDSSGTQLTSFTYPTSGTINPGTSGTPNYAPISVILVDHNTIEQNSAIQSTVLGPPTAQSGTVSLLTYVRFFGHTLGGQYVESDEFGFPIDICKGCRIQFTQADNNPACGLLNCFGTGNSATQLPLPCIPGEDVFVDCSQCLEIPDCHGAVPPGETLLQCETGGTSTDAGGGGG
jgi:hypothetical protein